MNKQLKVLLVFVGVLGAGVLTTLPIFRVKDDVTTIRLRDGGVMECESVDMLCDVRVSDVLAAEMADAGRGNGQRYNRLAIDVRQCGDAGIIITDPKLYADGKWLSGIDVIEGSCLVVADAGVAHDPLLRTVQQDCACRKATGNCRFTQADGGLAQLPFGITGGPPTLVGGGGCLRKSCVALASGRDDAGNIIDDSWPSECPGG